MVALQKGQFRRDNWKKLSIISFAGGHKLFDEVNKQPCAPGMNKN